MKRNHRRLLIAAIAALCAILLLLTVQRSMLNVQCPASGGQRVVACIPVFGQSLALGEEAVLVTDFDQLVSQSDGRILTQNLDYRFGYFDNSLLKQAFKRLVRYKKRTFQLAVYSMAEQLAAQLGNDTLICIFPGGQGETHLAGMCKPTHPYNRLLSDIRLARKKALQQGWNFYVPAICWMQGESDIADYPGTDYKQLLHQISKDFNRDIKAITGQESDVRLISYQTNAVTRGNRFKTDSYKCVEALVPQAQMELLRDDTLFWASGPTYPYTFAREAIHIDGVGQYRLGCLVARSALSIIRGGERFLGLLPLSASALGNDIQLQFNVPTPPLKLDTTLVRYVDNYGFSVITPTNENILNSVSVDGTTVTLKCSRQPQGCRVRYAVNGEYMKSGHLRGPRGNLRDSQGDRFSVTVAGKNYPLHNWCYQFDFPLQ